MGQQGSILQKFSTKRLDINRYIKVIKINIYFKKSQWQAISNMSTRRSSVGVGVVGSFLYSVGGYDGHSRNTSNIFFHVRVKLDFSGLILF